MEGFITAPSGITPSMTNRHRAISSLRARATTITLRIRRPVEPTSSVAINCCQQSILVRLDGALRLGSRQTRRLRCQYPALVAQLNRKNERVIVIDGGQQYVRRP